MYVISVMNPWVSSLVKGAADKATFTT